MRAFSRIPQGAGAGLSGQSPVYGQSNRSTSATYFDAQGVMRVAPPYTLRPNYVYQNGVWVRQGWLKEGQSTNYLQDSAWNNGLPLQTGINLLPGVAVYLWENKGNDRVSINIANIDTHGIYGKITQSIFVKSIGNNSIITLSRPWYWGPASDYDLEKGTSSFSPMPITSGYSGGWYRIGGWEIAAGNSPSTNAVLSAQGPFSFLLTCNSLENGGVEDSSGDIIPSSWVPYSNARAAD